MRSRVVRDQRGHDEAVELAQVAEPATSPDDLDSQVLSRAIRAPSWLGSAASTKLEALGRTAVQLRCRARPINPARFAVGTGVGAEAAPEGRQEARRLSTGATSPFYARRGDAVADRARARFSSSLDSASTTARRQSFSRVDSRPFAAIRPRLAVASQ